MLYARTDRGDCWGKEALVQSSVLSIYVKVLFIEHSLRNSVNVFSSQLTYHASNLTKGATQTGQQTSQPASQQHPLFDRNGTVVK